MSRARNLADLLQGGTVVPSAKVDSSLQNDFNLIHTIDASNQAAVTFTSSHITDTYMDYKITVRYYVPVTNGQSLFIHPSVDNGSNYNVLIEQHVQYHDMKGNYPNLAHGNDAANGNSQAKIQIGSGTENTANKGMSAEIYLMGLRQTTGLKAMYYNAFNAHDADGGHNTGNDYWWNGGAKIIGTSNSDRTAINNLKFTTGSGNINAGKFSLYGIKS